MKSKSLTFIFTLTLAAVVLQTVGVQSVDAQERMFGNGRFLKRMFNDLVPKSESEKKPTPAPAAKKGQLKANQPTAAHRPSRNAQPTLAGQANRPRSTKPRSNQPARSEGDRNSINRLPKSTASPDSLPTRSNAKATLGFGMLVKLRSEKLYVAQLDPKGNAAIAGVRVGDRLVAGGGIDFESLSDYNGVGDILEDGDQLEFELERGGREKELMIVYGEVPEGQTAMIEGSVRETLAQETKPSRSMLAPRVDQINTRSNSSFMPTQQNTEVQPRNQLFSSKGRQTSGRSSSSQTIRSQQQQVRSRLQQQVGTTPAPSLQLPPAAESVLN